MHYLRRLLRQPFPLRFPTESTEHPDAFGIPPPHPFQYPFIRFPHFYNRHRLHFSSLRPAAFFTNRYKTRGQLSPGISYRGPLYLIVLFPSPGLRWVSAENRRFQRQSPAGHFYGSNAPAQSAGHRGYPVSAGSACPNLSWTSASGSPVDPALRADRDTHPAISIFLSRVDSKALKSHPDTASAPWLS